VKCISSGWTLRSKLCKWAFDLEGEEANKQIERASRYAAGCPSTTTIDTSPKVHGHVALPALYIGRIAIEYMTANTVQFLAQTRVELE
jgi:hypothetical protein